MKVTKQKIKQIIQEELDDMIENDEQLEEAFGDRIKSAAGKVGKWLKGDSTGRTRSPYVPMGSRAQARAGNDPYRTRQHGAAEVEPDPAKQDPEHAYSGAGEKGPKKVGSVFGGGAGDPYQYMEVSPGNFQARKGIRGEWKDVKGAKAIASIKSVQTGGKSHWKPEDSKPKVAEPKVAEPKVASTPEVDTKAAPAADAVSELKPGDRGFAYDAEGLAPGETEEDTYPDFAMMETYKRWGELIK
tara:strand:+ start:2786 stop:3514 length:729 start_codon:yes stop_codon:yes gene_type:complete